MSRIVVNARLHLPRRADSETADNRRSVRKNSRQLEGVGGIIPFDRYGDLKLRTRDGLRRHPTANLDGSKVGIREPLEREDVGRLPDISREPRRTADRRAEEPGGLCRFPVRRGFRVAEGP